MSVCEGIKRMYFFAGMIPLYGFKASVMNNPHNDKLS